MKKLVLFLVCLFAFAALSFAGQAEGLPQWDMNNVALILALGIGVGGLSVKALTEAIKGILTNFFKIKLSKAAKIFLTILVSGTAAALFRLNHPDGFVVVYFFLEWTLVTGAAIGLYEAGHVSKEDLGN